MIESVVFKNGRGKLATAFMESDELEISPQLTYEELENELNLKQLQLKSLLAITQAINDNVSADGLFNMYKTFINWDMRVDRMVLFVREGDQWVCPARINVDYEIAGYGIIDRLQKYTRLQTISEEDEDPILNEFDIVIPVMHKETPLSYTLIGGFQEQTDVFNKVQFIQTITNIITVAIENKRLFKDQLKQERLNRTMQLATQVQQMFIPDELPKKIKYQIDSIYQPHFNIGGDYFDYFELNRDEFIFCIADVSGKGVGAAMLMANFQALLHSMVNKYDDLRELVQELNRAVYTITKSDKFITFFIAKINTAKRRVWYVNAGHCPVLYTHAQGQEFWHSGCTVLGAIEELKDIEQGAYTYKSGSVIMAYTDGLTELENKAGEFFDEDHLWAFGFTYHNLSADEFNRVLLNRLDNFRGAQAYKDDIAVITCKLT